MGGENSQVKKKGWKEGKERKGKNRVDWEDYHFKVRKKLLVRFNNLSTCGFPKPEKEKKKKRLKQIHSMGYKK